MRNQYAGTCYRCGKRVEAGDRTRVRCEPLSHRRMSAHLPSDLTTKGPTPMAAYTNDELLTACKAALDGCAPFSDTDLKEIARALKSRLQAEAPAHPEDKCQHCHGPNVVWFAPNNLWNKVVGSPNGILCPICFIQKAGAAGIDSAWKVGPEPSQAEAQAPAVTREDVCRAINDWFADDDYDQKHLADAIMTLLPTTPAPASVEAPTSEQGN